MKGSNGHTDDDLILEMIRDQHRREQGYRLLMNAYQEPLYWHIRRIVLTHEDANDVVQNVWIKIFKNIERFKGDSKLFTWMYKIATNEALTHIKKIQRKHAVSLDDENAVIRLLKADDYFEGSDIEAQLHAAISKLPEKQKLVFNMRYFDDMSYKEMQKVLGTSIGALKASYHHAVKKIEQFIMQSEKT